METKGLNLKELLKGHEGEKFYSPVYGYVTLSNINDSAFPLTISSEVTCNSHCLTENGKYYLWDDAECILFPSKDQRDWNKWIEEQKNKIPKTFDEIPLSERDYFTRNIPNFELNCPQMSAIALIKINQLIEVGYGGNITKEEWENPNVSKLTIDYSPKSEATDISNTNRFNHIAFHTYGQAKEFISYPENVKLIKVFCML